MRALLLSLFVTATISGFAQKAPIKFGDVSIEELKMTKYDKDTSAAAVILTDFGESRIDYVNGWVLHFERVIRIKILRKDGYAAADFAIPLYNDDGDQEKVSVLKGTTFNLEGGKKVESKLNRDGAFKEKYSENYDLLKFSLPDVKVGSVIDVTYVVLSPFYINFWDWEFQSEYPTKWSEYRTRVPEYFNYQRTMQGYVQLSINEDKVNSETIQITTKERSTGTATQTTFDSDQANFTRTDSRLVAQDVPAFKREPYMSNYKDYISRMNYELAFTTGWWGPRNYLGTWENVNQNFLASKSFGLPMKTTQFLTGLTQEVIAGATDPIQQATKIYDYVKSNLEWNGYNGRYLTEEFKKTLELKKGSASDLNLLLTTMLQRAGLDANPVLISTRSNGFIRKQIPASGQFNYVICLLKIGDKSIFLDATDRNLPMMVIPQRCLNGDGLVISEKFSAWVPVVSAVKARTVVNFDLGIAATGELTGTVNMSKDGYDARDMRVSYVEKGEKNYLSELAAKTQWEFEKSTFENVTKLSEPVKEVYQVKIAEHTQVGGDVIYLHPYILGKLDQNPFKLETRVYPVDFGNPSEQIIMGKFTIPPGYTVEELPKPKMLMLPKSGVKFVHSVSLVGDKIQFSSQFTINQPLFVPEEYGNLREFYNQVVAKEGEQIVIKKK